MINREMFFKSDFGNVAYDCYIPKDFNQRVIQIAHGMVEHRGRYKWLCEKLAQMGYKVYINDHRGHGDSVGGGVYLGEMGENGFENAVKDMLILNQIIREENTDAKIVLLGHSMGSLLSRRFLQLYEDRIDALILSGTPSPNIFAGFGSKLCYFLKKLSFNDFLHIKMQKLINHLVLGAFNSKFKNNNPKSPSHWICSNKDIVKDYDNDKKCQFIFSLNSFENLLKGLKQVFSDYPNVRKNNLPILFLSGEEDACGEFSKGVKRAYKHICNQGYKDVNLYLYPSCRHEVFNEINKEQYLQDMLEWLKSHQF